MEVKKIKENSLTCLCGFDAQLVFSTNVGRFEDKLITVKNIPTYVCSCGENFYDESVVLRFGVRVETAFKIGIDSIEY